MSTKDNTSDQDTKDSAVALLTAAEHLAVDRATVLTSTARSRIAFEAPTAVYDEAAVHSFRPTPPGGGPATVTATLTATWLGIEDGSGDSLGWDIDAELAATSPVRQAILRIGGQNHGVATGGTYTALGHLNTTGFLVRLIDAASGLYDEQLMTVDNDGGELTVTVNVP